MLPVKALFGQSWIRNYLFHDFTFFFSLENWSFSKRKDTPDSRYHLGDDVTAQVCLPNSQRQGPCRNIRVFNAKHNCIETLIKETVSSEKPELDLRVPRELLLVF